MTIILYCALIAILLPFASKMPLAYAMHKAGGYNNKNPRKQQDALEGFGARAKAAHYNTFESLIMFSVALAVVLSLGNTGQMIQNLAIAHIVARIIYVILYLTNLDILRSLVWGVGFFTPIGMIWLSIPA